jgi:hypothetical protein
MMGNEACITNEISLKAYSQAVSGMLLRPRRFFMHLPESAAPQALVFLIVCAAAHSIASPIYAAPSNYFVASGISLANAVGMAFLMTGIGYVLARISGGARVSFDNLFSVYAFSSGITLLVSWVPSLLVLTEIWKWWMVGTGLTHGLGFKWYRALAIIVFSIGLTVLLFHWLLSPGAPVTTPDNLVE